MRKHKQLLGFSHLLSLHSNEDKNTEVNQHQRFIFFSSKKACKKKNCKMHKMIVYVGAEGGAFQIFENGTLPCQNQATERRGRRKTADAVKASFSCKATSIHRSSLSCRIHQQRCIHLKCLDDNSIETFTSNILHKNELNHRFNI